MVFMDQSFVAGLFIHERLAQEMTGS